MPGFRAAVSRFFSAYSMVGVLALLCLYFSLATHRRESPTGAAGGRSVAAALQESGVPKSARIRIACQDSPADREFAAALASELVAAGFAPPPPPVFGDPPAVRAALERATQGIDVLATTQACRSWTVWERLKSGAPAYAKIRIVAPSMESRSTFLTPGNLRNVADQIAVIAILAIGMTMVILTRGIDLSVGSLLALSAVVTAWLVQRAGGASASTGAQLGAALAGIGACGAVGAFSGGVVARFKLPPFIATLGMMQVASGLAFLISQGQTLYELPARFTWLGRGTWLGLSNAVWLMALCYGAAHVYLTRTKWGRYIYAVGGNPEAAHLSGVAVPRVLIQVYVVSGLAAGLGGVILASQLGAGAPTYGATYELYVIAAVVVGGTSLSGGAGRVLGTLIGALIIAVIQNGMNLMNIEAYTQKVVLGLVILGAVLLDTLRRSARVERKRT